MSIASLNQTFFSPYGKDYCVYFYALTVASFIFLVMALFNTINLAIKGELGLFEIPLSLLGPFLLYFNNRMLYSMCDGALN